MKDIPSVMVPTKKKSGKLKNGAVGLSGGAVVKFSEVIRGDSVPFVELDNINTARGAYIHAEDARELALLFHNLANVLEGLPQVEK